VRIICFAIVIALSAGCGSGRVIYPHPPGEPGTDPGPEITGVSCDNPSASCEDVAPGSGERVKAFALVTVRVTADDLFDPPRRVGPKQVSFLHPPLGTFEFRGRDRDLSGNVLTTAGPAFSERSAEALVGTWIVGMRRGSSRRVHGRYAGTLGGVELPAGRDRNILIDLLDFCYPTIRLRGRVRWSSLSGSGGPVQWQPAVSISGCGSGS